MTLVVTHTEGFLGCFTVNPDGSMRQRALIDTGSQSPTPQALAELGMNLAGQYDWALNGVHPPAVKALSKKPAALPAARKGKPEPHSERRASLIVEYLKEHPNSSLKEILQGMGLVGDTGQQSRWHHNMHTLMDAGTVVRARAGKSSSQPFRYSLLQS